MNMLKALISLIKQILEPTFQKVSPENTFLDWEYWDENNWLPEQWESETNRISIGQNFYSYRWLFFIIVTYLQTTELRNSFHKFRDISGRITCTYIQIFLIRQNCLNVQQPHQNDKCNTREFGLRTVTVFEERRLFKVQARECYAALSPGSHVQAVKGSLAEMAQRQD